MQSTTLLRHPIVSTGGVGEGLSTKAMYRIDVLVAGLRGLLIPVAQFFEDAAVG